MHVLLLAQPASRFYTHSLMYGSFVHPSLFITLTHIFTHIHWHIMFHVLEVSASFMPLAGVNGGYFFEVNRKSFFDDVCFGKVRNDALHNVSMTDPNAGTGIKKLALPPLPLALVHADWRC